MVMVTRSAGVVSCAGTVITFIYHATPTTIAGEVSCVVSLPIVVRKAVIGSRVTRTSSITCSGVVKEIVNEIAD